MPKDKSNRKTHELFSVVQLEVPSLKTSKNLQEKPFIFATLQGGIGTLIKLDPEEYSLVGAAEGGIYYLSGWIIEMESDGAWKLYPVADIFKESIRNDLMEALPEHRIYKTYRKAKKDPFRIQIGTLWFRLSKDISSAPLKRPGWGLRLFERRLKNQSK
jgi:hypothetical protein